MSDPQVLQHDKDIPHQAVMINEVLAALGCQSQSTETEGRYYIDCTLGMGGHTEAILKTTTPFGKVIGIDRDKEALEIAKTRLSTFENRITFHHGPFKEILQIIANHEEQGENQGIDGIIFDLGISSFQLDTATRGFSFQKPGPLDMRMDASSGETAATLINRLPQSELVRLIKTFGEERWAARIASGIIQFRQEKGNIERTEELEDIIWRATPARFRHGRIHPATRTFQALRMVVNREIEEIESGLETAISLLKPGGRLVVISFHSLEDRPVKHIFRDWEKKTKYSSDKKFINLYKKPVMATPDEILKNRRARSAKLRALARAA